MKRGKQPSIVWFRQDLRLGDNPALVAALKRGAPLIPVFIWAPEEEGKADPGAASKWWLHQSLASLDTGLRECGSRLILRRGESRAVLHSLAQETGADVIFWNRRYEPSVIARDTTIKADLRSRGLTVESYNANLLFEPWQIRNKQGKPFQVFSPFWKTCTASLEPHKPLPAPSVMPAPERWPRSESLPSLALEPTIDWAAGIRAEWQPGEPGAQHQLARFHADAVARYPEDRDRPDHTGTSRLAPYLHFGELSPRQIVAAIQRQAGRKRGIPQESAHAAQEYIRQLGWREFAYHLLFHFPHTSERALRAEFDAFPWRESVKELKAWQRGRTGYPLVDAGMRELWETGWMHNRVRMVVASFLVKHLLLPWQAGAAWFWDTLLDADLANNTLGWQWTTGCGADAAPYFRIFNPVAQGEKFDPQGDYVRRWVPELAALSAEWIQKPWEAPAAVLSTAGVALGETYPQPIVGHTLARTRALAALKKMKQIQKTRSRH